MKLSINNNYEIVCKGTNLNFTGTLGEFYVFLKCNGIEEDSIYMNHAHKLVEELIDENVYKCLDNLTEPVTVDWFIERFGEDKLEVVDEYVSDGRLNCIDNVISVRGDDINVRIY